MTIEFKGQIQRKKPFKDYQVTKDYERVAQRLQTLQRDLASAQRAADEAQGMGDFTPLHPIPFITCKL